MKTISWQFVVVSAVIGALLCGCESLPDGEAPEGAITHNAAAANCSVVEDAATSLSVFYLQDWELPRNLSLRQFEHSDAVLKLFTLVAPVADLSLDPDAETVLAQTETGFCLYRRSQPEPVLWRYPR